MPTPDQIAALESAAAAKFADDDAKRDLTTALDAALAPYRSLEALKPGQYALSTTSRIVLVKTAEGKVGVDRPPVLSDVLKGVAE